MKYKLRDLFSIHNGKEVIVGPCEIELTLEEAKAHQHKLEEFPEQDKHVSYDPKEVNEKASKPEPKSEDSNPSKGKK